MGPSGANVSAFAESAIGLRSERVVRARRAVSRLGIRHARAKLALGALNRLEWGGAEESGRASAGTFWSERPAWAKETIETPLRSAEILGRGGFDGNTFPAIVADRAWKRFFGENITARWMLPLTFPDCGPRPLERFELRTPRRNIEECYSAVRNRYPEVSFRRVCHSIVTRRFCSLWAEMAFRARMPRPGQPQLVAYESSGAHHRSGMPKIWDGKGNENLN